MIVEVAQVIKIMKFKTPIQIFINLQMKISSQHFMKFLKILIGLFYTIHRIVVIAKISNQLGMNLFILTQIRLILVK